MYLIKFTDAQYSNALEFLNRATMTGKEIPAFLEVLNAIRTATKEDETNANNG